MKIDAKWTLILVALVLVCSIATGGIYVALEDKIAENDFGDGDDIDISTLLPGATDLKKIDIDILKMDLYVMMYKVHTRTMSSRLSHKD